MKTKLNYTVRTTRAPGEARDTVVPVIVERLSPVELETVVENCIDRGLVAGLKPTAAHGIAEGVAAQIAREFSLGRGVQFGQYFYGRPYLSGTVDANGRLTGGNRINVRLYKGAEFKLALEDFSFTFDGAGDAVKVDFLLSDADGAVRGELVENAPLKLNGRNLYAAGDTDRVLFAEVGGAAEVEVSAFTAQGADLLAFAWPSGLAVGKSYRVMVERTDVNGVTRTGGGRTVTVVAGGAAPEPIAESSDGVVKVMAYSPQTVPFGGSVTVTGSGLNFDGATGIGVSEARVDLPDDPGNIVTITGRSDGSISMTLPEGSGGAEPGTYSCTLYLLYSADGDPDHGAVTISSPIQVVVG